MPRHAPASGPEGPEAEHVNTLIRRLMTQPPTPERTALYAALLDEWDQAHSEPPEQRAA